MKRSKPTIRSGPAEYLSFVAAGGEGDHSVEMRYEDENIWLTTRMMAELFAIDEVSITKLIGEILSREELKENEVLREYPIDGMNVPHYALQMIISVAFSINNDKAIQFRRWANAIIKDYTIKGWVMDSDRLKNSGSVLTNKYFSRLLEEVREIRASERKFYQKIADLYETALDYDPDAPVTSRFFAKLRDKLHWAIHGHTVAELIADRADSRAERMRLQSWGGRPGGKVLESDVVIAENYLTPDEIDLFNRVVSMYLDYAEHQALRKIPMTMADWEEKLDRFLQFNEWEMLDHPERVTQEVARAFAASEFEKYRIVQDRLYRSDFDRFLDMGPDEGPEPINECGEVPS